MFQWPVFNSGDCLLQDSKILDPAKSFASFAHDFVTHPKGARLKQMQSGNKGQLTTWMKTINVFNGIPDFKKHQVLVFGNIHRENCGKPFNQKTAYLLSLLRPLRQSQSGSTSTRCWLSFPLWPGGKVVVSWSIFACDQFLPTQTKTGWFTSSLQGLLCLFQPSPKTKTDKRSPFTFLFPPHHSTFSPKVESLEWKRYHNIIPLYNLNVNSGHGFSWWQQCQCQWCNGLGWCGTCRWSRWSQLARGERWFGNGNLGSFSFEWLSPGLRTRCLIVYSGGADKTWNQHSRYVRSCVCVCSLKDFCCLVTAWAWKP